MKLDAVRSAALALPDTTEEPHHQFGSFRVRGRIFVTMPPDQHHIHVFLDEVDREGALALYPGFTEKLLWGGKVVGVRIALADADPEAVTVLLRQAHAFQAAKPVARSARKVSRSR